MKIGDDQICTLRELVMAHNASQRSLHEFCKSCGINEDELSDEELCKLWCSIDKLAMHDARTIDAPRVLALIDSMNLGD